ncbi:uncharacterized protein BDR25DRAFT_303845 [Lindgomyces ingoldianus]|uniref:Uncharacterized protein n=1 Tax=Lindgomyces ingoldianus TaxID=673940 RepID=A0ACB6QVK2_9PLEO|nr:uncharacterized protein BDR25DRAFT_303845 [Lindgomyces ingoldianus]KAF2470307.1 hypothetical protein BDR25DRAFT_303845 [Lindgomyces ingoldianus]
MTAETPSPPPDRGVQRQPVPEKGAKDSAAKKYEDYGSRASSPRQHRRSRRMSEDGDSRRARHRSRSRSRSGDRCRKNGSRRDQGDPARIEGASRSRSRERKSRVTRAGSKGRTSKDTSRERKRDSRREPSPTHRKRDASREPYRKPRDRSADRRRDRSRNRPRHHSKDRRRDRSRDNARSRSRDRQRDRSKYQHRDRSQSRDRAKDKRRSRSLDRQSRRSASPLPFRPRKRRSRSPSPPRRHRRDSRSPTPNKSKRRKHAPSRSPSPPPRSRKPLPSQEVSFRGLDNSDKPPTKYGGIPPDKEKPNFAPTGLLAKEANTVTGTKIALKYHEPPEARKPPSTSQWRLFVFKGPDVLSTIELHTQSCWLLGRAQEVADIVLGHPSSSSQHAAIQFRYISKMKEDEYGVSKKTGKVKPYLIDLESSNGTEVNGERIEARRYYELRDKDIVKFGASEREYVIMLPPPEK